MAAGPDSEAGVIDAIREAIDGSRRLSLVAGASKASMGAPTEATPLSLAGLRGVVDYDAAELVLTVRPGTPLRDLEAMLAAERQMFAFEPFDHGPIFGGPADAATIGGVVATAAAGSRRLSAGGVRDHVLGIRAVSGRAETFVAGAKVVKNVTGYDLPKLAAGSWGRLFAITELTLKVLPRPETTQTFAVTGLDVREAVRAMSLAMGSPASVAAAAHRPAHLGSAALTALRLEGFEPSVAARAELLAMRLAEFGPVGVLDPSEADPFWTDLRTLAPLAGEPPLWRINVPPSAAARTVEALSAEGAPWLMDWAGGLIWIASAEDPARLRAVVAAAGGHAMLIRAGTALRGTVPTLHPQSAGVAALEERVRRAFDPVGVFETGRF